jgi:YidC/Oxa1 family membrane protein insertase
MKNKETIIGWVLIAALFAGFIYYQDKKFKEDQHKKAEIALEAKRDSLNTVKNNPQPVAVAVGDSTQPVATGSSVAAVAVDSATSHAQYGAFATAANGEEKTFVIENDLQKITLSSKGGQIQSVELKKYLTWDKKPLILFTGKTNSLSYQFAIDNNRVIDTKDFYFEPTGEVFKVSGDSSKTFSLRLSAGEGKYFEQSYTLKGNTYLLDYNVNMVGLNGVIPANNNFISGTWSNTLSNLEHNIDLERQYSALYFRYNKSDVSHLDEGKEDEELVFDAPLEWISYKQQFFNTTLFSNGEFNRGKLKARFTKDDHSYVKKYDARFTMPYNPAGNTNYKFQFYIGPNSFNTLAALDKDAESIIKLGYDFWMFSWIKYITRFMIWVFSWFDSVHLNYGIIILLMTLILKNSPAPVNG